MTETTPPATASHGQNEFNHILLWMPNWIGDVVLSLLAIQSLRARFPKARLTAVTQAHSEELLRGHPDIDTVIRIAYGRQDGFLDKMEFARGLKKYGFDLALVFPNSFRSAFMTALTGAKARLGYATNGRGFLLTHPLPLPGRAVHRTQYYFKILEPLGVEKMETQFCRVISKESSASLEKKMRAAGLEEGEPFITVHPGSSKPERGWHANRYGMLCQRLIKSRRLRIAVVGREVDAPLVDEIRNVCPPQTVVPLLDLGLREAAALIEKSIVFIGNDSGMMHLAAMMGASIVALFGPGHPDFTGPFVPPEKKIIVTKNYPCSPCRQRFFEECRPSPHQKPYCLEDISVNDVARAVEEMLERCQANRTR